MARYSAPDASQALARRVAKGAEKQKLLAALINNSAAKVEQELSSLHEYDGRYLFLDERYVGGITHRDYIRAVRDTLPPGYGVIHWWSDSDKATLYLTGSPYWRVKRCLPFFLMYLAATMAAFFAGAPVVALCCAVVSFYLTAYGLWSDFGKRARV